MDIKILLNNTSAVKASQLKRLGKEDTTIDTICELYNENIKLKVYCEDKRRLKNIVGKEMGLRRKNGDISNITIEIDNEFIDKCNTSDALKTLSFDNLQKVNDTIYKQIVPVEEKISLNTLQIDKLLKNIGNIVHESVPVSMNEDDNVVCKVHGQCLPKDGLLQHPDIMAKLGMDTTERATSIAGNRGYYLSGDMFLLQQGLIFYAQQFLIKKGYNPFYTPVFMQQSSMNLVSQLSEFDDTLYHISGNDEGTTHEINKKYLIATSEQPMVAYYSNINIPKPKLPIMNMGFSSCFRKETGSCGKDTLGIFRVHQFEKIEQFVLTSPYDSESWKMMDQMLNTSEEFYQSLGIDYRVINIVSGALNNAASKKYDIEGWFPISKTFRELVSCSNCTDYQSRNVNCVYGQVETLTKSTTSKLTPSVTEKKKDYVHMLNSTLCAVTRTMCIICETYQTNNGVTVPDVLVPFVGKERLIF